MQPTLFDIESKEATLWHEIGFDRPVGASFGASDGFDSQPF